MKMGKGKNILIKDDISGDLNTTYRGIKTLKPLV
jgi:hypothetical protein